MILLYRIIFLPALVLALPYYLFRMWRRGGYGKDFQHRLGRFRRLDTPRENVKRVWLQAVSVGEVLAVGPLIDALQAHGKVEIVLTTTTSTGYTEALKRYADRVQSIGIFPLDFWLCSRLAWKRIQPDAIILTEGELWPEHLHQAKLREVPCYLVNARMSDRSFKRYAKFSSFACRLLDKFRMIYAASDHDAHRLERLGADPERIHMTGSIKLDVPLPTELEEATREELINELGFQADDSASSLVLLGSSTWPGEETALIESLHAVRAKGTDLRLLLVPRHAERGPSLKRLLQECNLPWHQRSSGTKPEEQIIVYLADTTGELSRLTQVADFAFVGKSLPPNEGGQTPIEAAGLGVPVLMGPNMNNFKAVASSLVQIGAAETVADTATLTEGVKALANDAKKRERMSAIGREWHRKNRGSCQRIAESILESLA
ncbi:3-deoxy-D-manno-octulosonic acid transferase [Coraliomargarita sinensis]|uniref:3-deoxy-D-manno-octulosonic acid transferase n=1 Tax=Coraliomargarita sinensis TaxID=2174842 RepID=A0A317ZM65_9BACT|nr:glycosyltransferase N-terminal domain-containing protein [Coraliomargarita sinensis]PXA04481.1 3-deoxy-D-manno-octulosonic acid transferase [Coraliomargarita sinensis]